MIKQFSFLLLFFLVMNAYADDLIALRSQYYAAVNNADAADKFYNELKRKNSAEPVVMAYFGSAQALKARYSWNPYNKLSYLKSGSNTLAAAVEKSPENLEIRLLRFSLEHYIPAFLGYSKNLDADRKKIISLIDKRHFGSLDKKILFNMIKFMKDSKLCNTREIQILNHALANG